jgi:GNAT superfamily N-acetyltransferase
MKYNKECNRCFCGQPACTMHKVDEAHGEGFAVQCKGNHWGRWAKTVGGAKRSWNIKNTTSSETTFVVSTDIYEYSPIFEGLEEDFGYKHWHSILVKCGVLEAGLSRKNKFKEVWLIKKCNSVIGMCGLYSQKENSTDELWLAWFGILPEYRRMRFGKKAIDFMEDYARSLGCVKLMAYVDYLGKPLPFYYKCGFSLLGTVSGYIEAHPELSVGQEFENLKDVIIWKNL